MEMLKSAKEKKMKELKDTELLVRQQIAKKGLEGRKHLASNPDQIGEKISNEIQEKIEDKKRVDPTFTLQMFNVNGYIAERLTQLASTDFSKQEEEIVGVHYRKDVRRAVGKEIAKRDAPAPAPSPALRPGQLPLVMRTIREQSVPTPAPAEPPTEPKAVFNPLMRK